MNKNWYYAILFCAIAVSTMAFIFYLDNTATAKKPCEDRDLYIGYNGTVFLDGFTFIFKRCEYIKDNQTERCAGLSFGNKTVLIDTDMPLSNLKMVASHEVCHEVLETQSIQIEEELCKFEHNITFPIVDELYDVISKISYCVIR